MSQNSSELRSSEDERTTTTANESDGGRWSTCSSSTNAEEDNRIRLAVYNLHKQIRLYHVGVLVRGKEFHYGIKIGVFTCEPKNSGKNFHVRHFNLFRWGIEFMRYVDIVLKKHPLYTNMSTEQLIEVMEELRPRYKWADYNLFNHNCMDFAMDFIRRISAVNLPSGKFFSWTQEIRQPLILLPIRKICETDTFKRTVKSLKRKEEKEQGKGGGTEKERKRERKRTKKAKRKAEKQRKERDNAEEGGQQTKERTESAGESPAERKKSSAAEQQQMHIEHRGALGLYITTIRILPMTEEMGQKAE
ncbi:hypothetical protein niasHT_010835 [Heterodera trifolii]|uniref:PPPDE domain-containing protein n=2 Tax=Heterodera trifolii TaxID=157864 RepID=A0ABD2KVD9_9BILA